MEILKLLRLWYVAVHDDCRDQFTIFSCNLIYRMFKTEIFAYWMTAMTCTMLIFNQNENFISADCDLKQCFEDCTPGYTRFIYKEGKERYRNFGICQNETSPCECKKCALQFPRYCETFSPLVNNSTAWKSCYLIYVDWINP